MYRPHGSKPRPVPAYVKFSHRWWKPHWGKFWKRRLHKAARQTWRQGRVRGEAVYASIVNWRAW